MQRLPNYRSRGHIRPSGAEQQTEVEQEEQEGSDPYSRRKKMDY
jgi:hypothetical protein